MPPTIISYVSFNTNISYYFLTLIHLPRIVIMIPYNMPLASHSNSMKCSVIPNLQLRILRKTKVKIVSTHHFFPTFLLGEDDESLATGTLASLTTEAFGCLDGVWYIPSPLESYQHWAFVSSWISHSHRFFWLELEMSSFSPCISSWDFCLHISSDPWNISSA